MTNQPTSCRAIIAMLLLIGCVVTPLRAQEPAQLEVTAADFGEFVAGKMHLLVCEMALLDPQTLQERTAEKATLQAEQRRLDKWFDSHDRDIGPGDLKTEEDKENYRAFRRVMANQAFLELPVAERRAFVTDTAARFRAFSTHLPAVLAAMCEGPDPVSTAALRAHLTERTSEHMGLGTRWFGRGAQSTIAAVYMGFTRSMYLNLNYMHENPDDFEDAFEHETWHHLMPSVNRNTAATNLWWEGCTEVVAECFSAEMQTRVRRRGKVDSSVQYPVQSAWLSLWVASDRQAAIALWSGARDEADILARFRAGTALQRRLAEQWESRLQIDKKRKKALETILSGWGWKEDGGGTIDIGNMLTDSHLDAEKVAKVFSGNRQLLVDLADAMSVMYLQELEKEFGRDALRALPLPESLADNLRAVLIYSNKPRRLFRAIDYRK